jgi:hypothetical protein
MEFSDRTQRIGVALMFTMTGVLFFLLSSSKTIGGALVSWGAILGVDEVFMAGGLPAAKRRLVRALLCLAVFGGACLLVYSGHP